MKRNLISIIVLCCCSFISCKKTNSDSCYDHKLYLQAKDQFCPQDCPGVKGCDGKGYCNACEAARYGIRTL
jgi:hypothetical protein